MKTYKDIVQKQIDELEKKIAEDTWDKKVLEQQLNKIKLNEVDNISSDQQLLKG